MPKFLQKAVWERILSEFQEAESSDVENHLRKRASAGANHRITFYVRIKNSTALAFAFLLHYSQPPDISKSPNYWILLFNLNINSNFKIVK